MSKMKELYEKVAGDSTLQSKFYEIMSNAEKAGEKATDESLIRFAKEAGYDITLDEIKAFFSELAEPKQGELSDEELDLVAGGKTVSQKGAIAASVLSLGLGCAAVSAWRAVFWAEAGGCKGAFE